MKISVKLDVKTPKSADDWELHTSSMKCGFAARTLTRALGKALRAVAAGMSAECAREKYFDPVASTLAKYGAADSEPGWIASTCLRHFQERVRPD